MHQSAAARMVFCQVASWTSQRGPEASWHEQAGNAQLRTDVRTPNSRRRRKKLISSSVYTSGSSPTWPSTCPTSLSARVSVGSTCRCSSVAHQMRHEDAEFFRPRAALSIALSMLFSVQTKKACPNRDH